MAGLRAIAVLPIVLFHAGLEKMSGGFVGVDVFFVISGFVITKSIINGMHRGDFSITDFYRRRIARIIPALILVITTTLLVGYYILLPNELKELGESSAAVATFLSNFFFLSRADYFGGAAEAKPLLHTWSLAVEEQFYIFYPLMMIILWRIKRDWIKPAILVLCALSFVLAVVVGQYRSELSFYMLPTRSWELGLGAAVAVGIFPQLSRQLKHILSAIGIILIVISIFAIQPNSFFPAPLGLIPTAGATLIIAYADETSVARILAHPFLKGIGDISYSLYLWHWPVITFYRLKTGFHLDIIETAILVVISVILAALTHRFVEGPGQRRINRYQSGFVVLAGVAALGLTAVVSLNALENPAKLRSYSPEVLRVAAVADYRDTADYRKQFRKGVCFMVEADGPNFNMNCLKIDPIKKNLVIFGDSHAAQYWRAFHEIRPDWNVIQATASGCRPLENSVGATRCVKMVHYVLRYLLMPGKVDEVIFAGRWRTDEVSELQRTAQAVRDRGISVTVIGPGVEYDGDLPLLMARAIVAGDDSNVQKRQIRGRGDLDSTMKSLFMKTDIRYISPHDIECPSGVCVLYDRDHLPIHFDYGHITLSRARTFVRQIEKNNTGLSKLRSKPNQILEISRAH